MREWRGLPNGPLPRLLGQPMTTVDNMEACSFEDSFCYVLGYASFFARTRLKIVSLHEFAREEVPLQPQRPASSSFRRTTH